jgi:hypothetical protein
MKTTPFKSSARVATPRLEGLARHMLGFTRFAYADNQRPRRHSKESGPGDWEQARSEALAILAAPGLVNGATKQGERS